MLIKWLQKRFEGLVKVMETDVLGNPGRSGSAEAHENLEKREIRTSVRPLFQGKNFYEKYVDLKLGKAALKVHAYAISSGIVHISYGDSQECA